MLIRPSNLGRHIVLGEVLPFSESLMANILKGDEMGDTTNRTFCRKPSWFLEVEGPSIFLRFGCGSGSCGGGELADSERLCGLRLFLLRFREGLSGFPPSVICEARTERNGYGRRESRRAEPRRRFKLNLLSTLGFFKSVPLINNFYIFFFFQI